MDTKKLALAFGIFSASCAEQQTPQPATPPPPLPVVYMEPAPGYQSRIAVSATSSISVTESDINIDLADTPPPPAMNHVRLSYVLGGTACSGVEVTGNYPAMLQVSTAQSWCNVWAATPGNSPAAQCFSRVANGTAPTAWTQTSDRHPTSVELRFPGCNVSVTP
jgi:hypothetical protein